MSEWEIKKLSQVSDFQGGSQPPKSQFISTPRKGYVRLLQIRDFKSDDKAVYIPTSPKNRICEEHDILIGRYGASVGQIHRGKSGAYNVALMKTIPDLDLIDKDFFYLYLISDLFQKQLSKVSDRSAQAGFSKPDIANFDIPIPPIEEQKRIVEILDKAFEGIAQAEANTRRNLANTRQFLANVRNNILNKNSNNWHPTTLKKEINLLSGFAFKSQFYTQSEDDISLLRGDNIMQGYLRWDNTQKWKKSEFDTFSKFKLKENDLVLAMDRPWVSAGLKYAEITSNDLPCLLVQRVARLRCCENLNNRFLFHLIGDRKFIKHILGKQTGIGVPHISGKQIESFEFLKPPLEKQKNIASLLDRIYSKTQKLETIYQSKLEAIAELKQSILEKAFTGQLSQ